MGSGEAPPPRQQAALLCCLAAPFPPPAQPAYFTTSSLSLSLAAPTSSSTFCPPFHTCGTREPRSGPAWAWAGKEGCAARWHVGVCVWAGRAAEAPDQGRLGEALAWKVGIALMPQAAATCSTSSTSTCREESGSARKPLRQRTGSTKTQRCVDAGHHLRAGGSQHAAGGPCRCWFHAARRLPGIPVRTLRKTTLSNWLDSSSNTGPIMRHGPHQVAVKSARRGREGSGQARRCAEQLARHAARHASGQPALSSTHCVVPAATPADVWPFHRPRQPAPAAQRRCRLTAAATPSHRRGHCCVLPRAGSDHLITLAHRAVSNVLLPPPLVRLTYDVSGVCVGHNLGIPLALAVDDDHLAAHGLLCSEDTRSSAATGAGVVQFEGHSAMGPILSAKVSSWRGVSKTLSLAACPA